MSQLLYCQVRLNRPNKQYDINYSSTSASQLNFNSELRFSSTREWKSLQNASKIMIPLTKFQDGVSDEIGEVNEDGFELDLKKMQTNKKYSVMYDDSIYEVYKNNQGELVVSEIG